MPPTTQLPPLPPPVLEDQRPVASHRTALVAVSALALLTAAVMALLWIGARNSENDATVERDSAIAERDAANRASIISDAELLTTQDELADARSALKDATDAAEQVGEANSEELAALQDQADELAEEIERLEVENEALATDLAVAEEAVAEAEAAAVAAAEAAASTTVVEPDASTTTTTAAPSVPPDEIGDQVSGLFRRSVLGPGQKSCLGEVLVNDFGEQRTLEGIASDSPRDDDEFVDAIRAAAALCNIDASAIFG